MAEDLLLSPSLTETPNISLVTAAPSEMQLLQQCIAQDAKAQLAIYEAYSKAMYNTALRFLNDVFEAEDIIQEAFLVAFEQLGAMENLNLFAGWLKQIVVNKSINRLKQQQVFETFKENVCLNTDVTEEVEIPGYLEVSKVKHALTELPKGYRAILSLYLFEGYDHEEIGEILEISSATSRSQYNRGKKKLRELLTQGHETRGIHRKK